jgi:hypothetical protein
VLDFVDKHCRNKRRRWFGLGLLMKDSNIMNSAVEIPVWRWRRGKNLSGGAGGLGST